MRTRIRRQQIQQTTALSLSCKLFTPDEGEGGIRMVLNRSAGWDLRRARVWSGVGRVSYTKFQKAQNHCLRNYCCNNQLWWFMFCCLSDKWLTKNVVSSRMTICSGVSSGISMSKNSDHAPRPETSITVLPLKVVACWSQIRYCDGGLWAQGRHDISCMKLI